MKRFLSSAFYLSTATFLLFILAQMDTGSIHSVHAQSATGGVITVIQKYPENHQGSKGKWTLLMPYHAQHVSRSNEDEVEGWPGKYTLITEPPIGSVATVRQYNGTTLEQAEERQLSFDLEPGDDMKITINYIFKDLGSISVASDPPGLEYVLRGPNRTTFEGVTPKFYESMPEGQYAVTYETLPNCPPPPIKSLLLEKSGRVGFNVNITCEGAEDIREQAEEMKEQFVTITLDGKDVSLTDVPQGSWFATFVFDSAKAGLVSGYKDANGNYTGKYGPSDLVNGAQLLKIAHRLGGVQEDEVNGFSINPGVPDDAWFTKLFVSAEKRGWTIFHDGTIDPNKPVTRAEVIVTLLQALDVPINWPSGEFFDDVDWKVAHAGSIETAAEDGIISGASNDSGEQLFRPLDPINRAELAKILVHLRDTYRGDTL